MRIDTLQKFAAVHGSVHNHFSQERHLVSRQVGTVKAKDSTTFYFSLAQEVTLISLHFSAKHHAGFGVKKGYTRLP